MEISFLGMNCVRIAGKDISILCDPYSKAAGMPDVKQAYEATLLTQRTENLPEKAGMVIDGPGEYEIAGSMITGVPAGLHFEDPEKGQNGTMYSVLVDGIRVAHVGNIAAGLSNEQVEALGQIDILVVPVGNHGLTLDAQAAAAFVSQLEPKYVIPTHFDDGKTKYEVPQDKVDAFLKEIGSNPEPQSKLKILAKDLPLETTAVVLQHQGA
jgi:L-ascorbate metabolism protein UlaG (beta-lactamase superfamily)